MTRRERLNNRQAKQVAARAVGLTYGPSECRSEDAEDVIKIRAAAPGAVGKALFETTVSVPVCYGLTRNRGILETVAG